MRKTFTIFLISTVFLTSCGAVRESRLNPFNWFGRSEPAQTQTTEKEDNPLIPQTSGINLLGLGNRVRDEIDNTVPIDTIADLRVERTPGGALIRATGVDARQGAYNVEIVPVDEDEKPVDGVLEFTLERTPPAILTPTGPIQTRESTAAYFVSDKTLLNVRTIRVSASQNALQVRRR